MTYKIEQIVLENDKAFCVDGLDGYYYCYEIGITHSTLKATISKTYGLGYTKEKHFLPRWGNPITTDKTIDLSMDKVEYEYQ